MRHFKSISEFHAFRELPPPLHPLLSVVDLGTVGPLRADEPVSMALDFYTISVKRVRNARLSYGQRPFDFNEGVLSFMAPRQVFSIAAADQGAAIEKTGWALYVHPDFIWNTPLAQTIRQYDFWDYSLSEALFLSPREEATVTAMLLAIRDEYQANLDRFSKPIIITQLETLLNYADRYYHRQFLTREKSNHQVLARVEALLNAYFDGQDLVEKGLPTVQYVADELHLSPKYLSNLLRVLTGQSTQQHIHDKLIEKAKEQLSTTSLTVSEIAYGLGFEHLPSFSKLFKAKTSLSPVAFRASFN